MNRRAFAGLSLAALGGIFVPQFGHWYRRGSGLVVPAIRGPHAVMLDAITKAEIAKVPLDPLSPIWLADFSTQVIPADTRCVQVSLRDVLLQRAQSLTLIYPHSGIEGNVTVPYYG